MSVSMKVVGPMYHISQLNVSGKAFLSRNPQWMVEKAQWRHVPSAAEQ
jgi:hypothetical protein